jgi:hypothetical protein
MSSDMACKMAKRLRRAKVEPPAMDVHDGLTGPRGFGSAPPSRNASNTVSLIHYANRGRDVRHDGVKRNSSGNSLRLAFVGLYDSAHGSHRIFVFRAQWMVHQPRSMMFQKCFHDGSPRFI